MEKFALYDLAQFIIYESNRKQYPLTIPKLEFILYKLQKKYDGELFTETIYASVNGPVITEIRATYHTYIQYKIWCSDFAVPYGTDMHMQSAIMDGRQVNFIPMEYTSLKSVYRHGWWTKYEKAPIDKELQSQIRKYLDSIKKISTYALTSSLLKDKSYGIVKENKLRAIRDYSEAVAAF